MRGQIWYIKKGKKYMERSGGVRPAIIVSNDELNSHVDRVMVVFLTTHETEHEDKVPVMVKNTQSYAICNNINTIFKDELRCYVDTVDDETMQKIEKQMANSLGIGSKDKAFDVLSFCAGCDAEMEKNALQKEKMEIAQEANFYKRAYEELLAKMMER